MSLMRIKLAVLVLTIWVAPVARAQTTESSECSTRRLAAADAATLEFTQLRLRTAVIANEHDAAREVSLYFRELARVIGEYERVSECGDVLRTITALGREGQLYEELASIISIQADRYPALRREQMEAECGAIQRYILALRSARQIGAPSRTAQMSLGRLQAYSRDRVVACVEAARVSTPSIPSVSDADLR